MGWRDGDRVYEVDHKCPSRWWMSWGEVMYLSQEIVTWLTSGRVLAPKTLCSFAQPWIPVCVTSDKSFAQTLRWRCFTKICSTSPRNKTQLTRPFSFIILHRAELTDHFHKSLLHFQSGPSPVLGAPRKRKRRCVCVWGGIERFRKCAAVYILVSRESNANNQKESRKETAKEPFHFWLPDENSDLMVWAMCVLHLHPPLEVQVGLSF